MLAGIPIHTAMKLTIDQDKCIHCHLCEKACFLTRFCGFDSLEGAAEQYCIGCGHCVAVCPRQAITHSGVKSTEPIGPVPGEAKVLNLLMKTRSVRHFKPDPVSRETWNVLRRAAEYSQSGLNAQSIRLKKLAQEGLLDDQIVYAVLAETKPNQQEQLKFKREELRKYFPSGYTEEQMRRDIIKGLELLKRQRDRNRDAR